jgi:phage head maturation protease
MKKKFLSLSNKSITGAATFKELWEKAQTEGYEGLALICAVEMTKDADTKKYHAVFSSETEDRHGEIVYQDFDLKAFKKNPVYLDSHNYDSIEHIIGKVSPLSVKEGKLQGDIEFATMNPKGLLAEKMADGGFLNTSSIGFIPKVFDDKGNILKSELLEISAVSVPANPEATFEKDADIEIPAPIEEVAPVIDEPGEVVGETRNVRGVVAGAVRGMSDQRQRTLSAVAREIAKLAEPHSEKRQVFKAVRELMKEAKADVSV